MSTFERYLTLWVGLCIVVGVAFGHVLPGVFQAIGSAEVAQVNLPVAVLIWLMITPMIVAKVVARPAPNAPYGFPVSPPMVSTAAKRMFSPTVMNWMIIVGFTMPVPRKVANSEIIRHWMPRPGVTPIR